jgi:hypothetical protein
MISLLLFFATLAPVAQPPNLTPVCQEVCVITAISSPTAVLDFGVGSAWCPTMITAPKLPLTVNYATPNLALCPIDPAQGVQKTLAAQMQASAYTVRWTANGVTTVTTIPALPATTTIYTFSCPATVAGTINATTNAITLGSVTLSSTCTAVAQ